MLVLTTKCTKTATTKRTKKEAKKVFFVFMFAAASFASFVVKASSAQQVLDRVVARVGASAITQTDVDAAIAFGIVDRQAGEPLKQIIDRRLMLAEVTRFPPPEPGEMAIAEQVARMKATAGSELNAIQKRTGVDEKRLTELARQTLRIQSYLLQRFGTGDRAESQRTRWLNDLRSRGDVIEVTPRP